MTMMINKEIDNNIRKKKEKKRKLREQLCHANSDRRAGKLHPANDGEKDARGSATRPGFTLQRTGCRAYQPVGKSTDLTWGGGGDIGMKYNIFLVPHPAEIYHIVYLR